jgi:hypothetical protein
MTENEIEHVAIQLYELDRQKGLRSHRWAVGSEKKRERYRARARELLSGEDFTRLVARLERRYQHAGDFVLEDMKPKRSSTHH